MTKSENPRVSTTDNLRVRALAALSYVLVIACLGLPLWQWTTKIYRANLDYSQMDYYDNNILENVKIRIPVYLDVGREFPDLHLATQFLVNEKLGPNPMWGLRFYRGLATRPKDTNNHYTVHLEISEDDMFYVDRVDREIYLTYTMASVSLGQIPHLLASVFLEHVFAQEAQLAQEYASRQVNAAALESTVAYSPRYHLTFSLLLGGHGDQPAHWDIDSALAEHFHPFLDLLSTSVTNITVDTQVQQFASLGVGVDEVQSEHNKPEFLIRKNELATFVDYADWGLTSIHPYPTLHFVIYVPPINLQPLRIENSTKNSFLVPQWGGVVIVNTKTNLNSSDLLGPLEIFASQLLELLGAPASPENPLIRIDSLGRLSSLRALMSASFTLGSLNRLSRSLPNIAIPKPVHYAVNSALWAIKQSCRALKRAQWQDAVSYAGRAITMAERAFFNKNMVQQAFFPEEHKIAVYLPLLGPILIVVLAGSFRMYKEIAAARIRVLDLLNLTDS